MKDEAWSEIKGFPNYLISNQGRVLNKKTGLLLRHHLLTTGYSQVRLSNLFSTKSKLVHRLVAEAFVPNPCQYPIVNHIDENRGNPHYRNLEWCTQQMNIEHSRAKFYKLRSPEGKQVRVFNLSKFARDNELSQGSLANVVSGEYKHHKGWSLWKTNSEEGEVRFTQDKCFIFRSPDGRKVECAGIRKFAREHNLNNSHLVQVALGKAKQHKGWTRWEDIIN